MKILKRISKIMDKMHVESDRRNALGRDAFRANLSTEGYYHIGYVDGIEYAMTLMEEMLLGDIDGD